MDISDLLEDSTRVTDANGEVSIVYRNKLSEFKFDRITDGFNKSFVNIVNLDNIDLGSRIVRNSLSLGKIAKKAGVAGALIIANNGNQMIVPPINGIGPETFRFDATDFFQTITLDDGWLFIDIVNGLPLELTNVQYTMENQSGGTPILTNTIASILPNSTYRDSVRLNNRTVIEGKLKAILQNLDSPGSNGNSIPIDTSQKINVTVRIDDLQPFSATAIFPDQILIRDTTNTVVESFNGQLTSMHVGSGKIFLDATSTIEDEIVFDYTIPSASKDGVVLQFEERVPPAPPSGFSNKTAEKDLAGYDVNLTGRPGDIGVYNTFYTVTNGRIDSSGNLINLSLEDSVFLETGVQDLIAKRAYGYLGKDTLSANETTDLDLFTKLKNGEFDFEEIKINLEIENYLGAGMNVALNSVQSRTNEGQTEDLTWTSLGQEVLIGPATENIPGQRPTPGLTVLELNKSNSNIDELIELQPDVLATDLVGYLNKSLSAPDYSQFAYVDYGLTTFISAEIPLNLSARDLLFRDTSVFSYSDIDPNGQLQGGDLILVGNNNFPFGVVVDIIMLNSDFTVIDTLRSSDFIQPALVGTDGKVVEMVKSRASFALTKKAISGLKNAGHLVFEASFNSANFPQKVKILEENYIDLILVGDLKVNSR